MQINEKIFIGRDNKISLRLYVENIPYYDKYPAFPIVRSVLTLGSIVIDSDNNPSAFNWFHALSRLDLKLGNVNTNPSLSTVSSVWAKLVVYATPWPNGLLWLHPSQTEDSLKLQIVNC